MEVLFSTSITMTAATIITLYRARFSMEFPFRDGKRPSVVNRAVLARTQFAGLSECQSRQVEALHFHWTMVPLEPGGDGGLSSSPGSVA